MGLAPSRVVCGPGADALPRRDSSPPRRGTMGAAQSGNRGGTVARGVVESFVAWAQDRSGLEPDVVETLVDLKADYLGDGQPGRWRSGDLSELLLEVVPRKISADDDWYAAVLPTTRAFLTRLHSRGELHRASAPVASLLAELDDVEKQFMDAVHDPSRSGMAKAVLAAVGLEGIPDAADLDEAMARFNALPFAERDAVLSRFLPAPEDDDSDDLDEDEDDLSDDLPGVRLPPLPELAEAARDCQTVRDLAQFDAWLGAGRSVTVTGVLTLKEARSLEQAMGWHEPPAEDEFPVREARSARDMPQLNDLWQLADEIGAVRIHRTRAYAGDVRPVLQGLRDDAPQDVPDEAVLALWQAAFEATLYIEPETGYFGFPPSMVSAAVRHAVVTAYEDDDHSIEQLCDEAFDVEAGERPLSMSPLGPGLFGMRLVKTFGRLAALGAALPVQDVHDTVSLTPLGMHGLRTLVLSRGGDAPLVGDVAGLPAERALLQIVEAGPDLARALAREWLGERDFREAVQELVDALREVPAAVRYEALSTFVTLDDVPPLIEELAAGDPLLGAVALGIFADFDVFASPKLAEVESLVDLDEETGDELRAAVHGLAWLGLDLPVGERDVLVVESLARVTFDVEEPVRTEDVGSAYWSIVDEPTVVRLTGSEHPEADAVLGAVATGHPAGRIRKAAKKALHKRGRRRRPQPQLTGDPSPGSLSHLRSTVDLSL